VCRLLFFVNEMYGVGMLFLQYKSVDKVTR
jgi:hypothetical protein